MSTASRSSKPSKKLKSVPSVEVKQNFSGTRSYFRYKEEGGDLAIKDVTFGGELITAAADDQSLTLNIEEEAQQRVSISRRQDVAALLPIQLRVSSSMTSRFPQYIRRPKSRRRVRLTKQDIPPRPFSASGAALRLHDGGHARQWVALTLGETPSSLVTARYRIS